MLKHSLFSAQSFAAGALALDVAFSLDMARPCRSVATVCITTQTFASTVCAKVIWRLP
ncbi:MAG: FUSC family protein [Inquilinus sp.]